VRSFYLLPALSSLLSNNGALHQSYARKNKKELRVEEFKGFRVEEPQYGLTPKHPNTTTPKLNSLEEKYA